MSSHPFPPGIVQGTASEWSSTAHLQTKWDWRAVGNFIGGGTGAGLLLTATLFAPTIESYRQQAFAALAIIALGLGCIMLKMGRPTRAFNVFRQVRTSWMTREGLAMPALFGCGALSLLLPGVGIAAWLATVSAWFFLYCQARILREAKGIPAWSQASIVPLILATGLAEGVGLGMAFAAWTSGSALLPVLGLLLVALLLRHGAWRHYRTELVRVKAPPESLAALGRFALVYGPLGQWLPLGLAVGALFAGPVAGPLAVVAGVLAAVSGWWMKAVIVTRAAYFHRKSFSLSAAMASGHRGGR